MESARERESLKIHGANIASDFITFALFFVGVEKFVVEAVNTYTNFFAAAVKVIACLEAINNSRPQS